MKAKEIRGHSDEELVRQLDEKREVIFRNRLKNATHQLDDTSSLRKDRREIARIKTVLNQREIATGAEVGATASEE